MPGKGKGGKRGADVAGLTVAGLEGPDHVSKASRTTAPSNLPNSSAGQRFGETVDYIPLTQVLGADEEDAAATEVVQGSQDSDDAATSNFIFYGMSNCSSCLCFGIIAQPSETTLKVFG